MEAGGSSSRHTVRRRTCLLDHMSIVENRRDSLVGLTLDVILKQSSTGQMAPASTQVNRTLLDIIRDEEPHGSLFGHKDKKSWKAFRDRIRLKRAGAAWTSSVPIPASDVPIHGLPNNNNSRSFMSRRNSVRFTTLSSADQTDPNHPEEGDNNSRVPSSRQLMSRRRSVRFADLPNSSEETEGGVNIQAVGELPTSRSFRPQMSRNSSIRFQVSTIDQEDDEDTTRRLAAALTEERVLSAREAVAAQEASEAAAQGALVAEEEEEEEEGGGGGAEPVRMSLMDLLEENDREMGFEGSSYVMGDELGDYEEEEEEEMEGGVEHTCCVCMVRHKGAAFIPCGHTFCRLCSRELYVQRGSCPLCKGFILEILDIF
ncbi:hypothetical protein K2173_017109 [Erythroxylum novogranatense]|uniref:RING-type domain-containing protein n=1 Tax=Erythroxylum novogranatense TaxID=1862640 RepID=A0AAV8UA05_9ROSI|nr:hypothetical protein K2173_017109 [Erythroxylum novogranatense]